MDQELENSLGGCRWLRTSHEASGQLSAGTRVIGGLHGDTGCSSQGSPTHRLLEHPQSTPLVQGKWVQECMTYSKMTPEADRELFIYPFLTSQLRPFPEAPGRKHEVSHFRGSPPCPQQISDTNSGLALLTPDLVSHSRLDESPPITRSRRNSLHPCPCRIHIEKPRRCGRFELPWKPNVWVTS